MILIHRLADPPNILSSLTLVLDLFRAQQIQTEPNDYSLDDDSKKMEPIREFCKKVTSQETVFDMKAVHLNSDLYTSFLHLCAICVVPDQRFKHMIKDKKPLHEWFTVDDEALAMVILENSVLKWNKEFALKIVNPATFFTVVLTKNQRRSLPTARFTEVRDGNKLLTGWGSPGVGRFTELKQEVMNFRGCNYSTNGPPQLTNNGVKYVPFSTRMMKEWLQMYYEKGKRTMQTLAHVESRNVKARNQVFDNPLLSMFVNPVAI